MSPSSTNRFICRTATCLRVTFNSLLDFGPELSPRGIVCIFHAKVTNCTNFILVFVTTHSGHTNTYAQYFFGSLPKGVRLSETVNDTCTPPTWTGEPGNIQNYREKRDSPWTFWPPRRVRIHHSPAATLWLGITAIKLASKATQLLENVAYTARQRKLMEDYQGMHIFIK